MTPEASTPGTETETEYGIRSADGAIAWPDGDGELYIGGSGYVTPSEGTERELMEKLAKETSARGPRVLVKRTVTRSAPVAVSAPLPRVPGAVVRASTAYNPERRLFVSVLSRLGMVRFRDASAQGLATLLAEGDLVGAEVVFTPEEAK